MAKAEKKETPKTKDELVAHYTKIVEAKEKEIASIESPRWKTPCSFKWNENSPAVNLHTIKDVNKLTAILAYLVGQERDYKEAASFLGVSSNFTHQGYTFNAWAEDIKTEIGKVTIAEKKQKLSELKTKLDSLESQETKEAKALAAIEAELSKM